jgi:adenine deaminase
MMLGFDRNASRRDTSRLRRVVLVVCAVGAACSQSRQYDLVINGGRVIDPETRLDAVRSVGIVGDRIARVSAKPLQGTKVIDATGLVVSPGFIDLHQHDQSPAAYRLKALDGVTSALEMETGVPDFAKPRPCARGRR